mgnify:CR=1 FL=1
MAETKNRTLLTMAEVAELISLSQSTVRRFVKSGILPVLIRLGPTGRSIRFKLSDIQQYLNNI